MSDGPDWTEMAPPDLAAFEQMADTAYRSIPEALRSRVDAVAIRVEDFPDEDTLREMEMESPFELLGLYRGVSLEHKTTWDVPQDLDMIFLYRRPLLDYWCETGEPLGDVIRNVLIHEIGHHFGYSDEEMEAIEAME